MVSLPANMLEDDQAVKAHAGMEESFSMAAMNLERKSRLSAPGHLDCICRSASRFFANRTIGEPWLWRRAETRGFLAQM